MINLEIINKTKLKVDKKTFETLCQNTEKILKEKFESGDLNLIIVDLEEIHDINKKWRQKDKPTDVISFSYLEGKQVPENSILGEIFICPEYIEQKKEHSLEFVFVHGLLHVFGFDHQNSEEEEEMNSLTNQILNL